MGASMRSTDRTYTALGPRPDATDNAAVESELPEPEDEARERASSLLPADDDRPLILVADGTADTQQHIVRLLAQRYRTEAVSGGEAALVAVRARTPNLVLIDAQMPRAGGFALLQALRAEPRTSSVPVVLLCAHAEEEGRINDLQEAACDCLVAPFSARELLALVAAQLQMARMRREAAAALRASEAHHRVLFDQTADGIVVADALGRYVDINAAACKMLGYSRDEMLALTIPDVLEPDEWSRIAPEIARSAGGQVMRSEWRFRRKDGSGFVGEITGSHLSDGRVQGILRDVTERRATDAAILSSEVQIRTILESITDGFFALDRDWHITYINTAGERFLDRTPGDLIGKVLWDEFPGTVDSEFERVYRQVMTGRKAESFTAYYPNFDSWYEVTVYPAAEGLTVYFRDVTEKKRSEKLLGASEERRRQALDAAELGTWNLEPASRAVQTDVRFRAIFGVTDEFPNFSQLFAVIHPDDLAAVQASLAAATRLEGPAPYTIEYRVVHPDGSLRWVSAKGRSSFEGVGPTRRVVSFDGTVADITDRKRGEDALQASEDRSQTILDSITDGFFAVNSDWRFTYMNAAGERSIDCTPGYLIGKCFWDEYPGTVGSEFERFYRRVAASRDSESLTAHYPDNDRWYEITAYPAPNGLSVYFRDVTHRRQVEQERQQFAALVEASPDFIGVAGLDQRGVYVNRAGMALSGLEPDQLASISVLDFFPESERDRILGFITESEGGKDVVVDTWFQHLQTGQLIPVSWSFLRLRDASGIVSGYATVTRDLTERKQHEKSTQQTLASIVERCPFGIYIVDDEFRIASMNEGSQLGAFANVRPIIGRSFDEAVRMMWPEPVASDVIQIFRHTLTTGEPYLSRNFSHARADVDQTEAYEWELHRIDMPNGRDGVVCYYFDSTWLREAERKLWEADRKKDEFLAILAHELRNPLAPIRNGLQLMKLARDNPEVVEKARSMMERQVAHMVRLIDDLLDLSRISQGNLELKQEQIELAIVMRNAVETSQPLIEQLGHALDLVVPSVPVYLRGDVTRLAQIISNLLNNSAKYTERGGRIRLRAEQLGRDIVITVEDNGMGIPVHMLSKIFEMFTQVDRSLEQSTGGLGIGLSLVQRLVELHGGSVQAFSEGQGRGSTFVVRLPTAMSVAEIRQDNIEPESGRSTPRLRILVVDDNRDAAIGLAELLSILGNETQTAHDGLEALEVAQAFRPDVTLLDIGMPKLNGFETCRRIRQQAWGESMVLYALTGWGQEEDQQRSLAAGFNAHLVKPVVLADLEALLAQVIAVRA